MQVRALVSVIAIALTVANPGAAQPAPDRATIPEIYSGPKRLPDFAGRDRKYRDYRTRITEGMRAGPNFGGHLTLIVIGCGAGCRFAYIGDLKSGQVYDFPLGGEDNMYLDLKFKPDSRTVRAYWEDNERCMHELLNWTGSAFVRAGAKDIGDQQVCRNAPNG